MFLSARGFGKRINFEFNTIYFCDEEQSSLKSCKNFAIVTTVVTTTVIKVFTFRLSEKSFTLLMIVFSTTLL